MFSSNCHIHRTAARFGHPKPRVPVVLHAAFRHSLLPSFAGASLGLRCGSLPNTQVSTYLWSSSTGSSSIPLFRHRESNLWCHRTGTSYRATSIRQNCLPSQDLCASISAPTSGHPLNPQQKAKICLHKIFSHTPWRPNHPFKPANSIYRKSVAAVLQKCDHPKNAMLSQ